MMGRRAISRPPASTKYTHPPSLPTSPPVHSTSSSVQIQFCTRSQQKILRCELLHTLCPYHALNRLQQPARARIAGDRTRRTATLAPELQTQFEDGPPSDEGV